MEAKPIERPESVFYGVDCDLLASMLDFYPRPEGPIYDVTANKRRMWKGMDTSHVVFCDIDPGVCPDVVADFRRLPFGDSSASLIVYDPPHLPSAAGTEASHEQYVADYGLNHSVKGDNVNAFHPPFLAEAYRVLKQDGLIFVKLSDYAHNHAYQWSLVDFVNLVKQTPGLTPCDLRIKRDPVGGNLKSGRWVRAMHARRVHSWWIIIRKGRCEPKKL